MDYDQTTMARDYDTARGLDAKSLEQWLAALRKRVPAAANVIDLGCGTGRFTQPLADFYGAAVLGVDPSQTMLAKAVAKPRSKTVTFARGAAEAIPAPDGGADLVFSSMAFHHFPDKRRAARECRRVLRTGGAVAIRNSTRENIAHSPYARFFAGFVDAANALQPAQAEIAAAFTTNGFVLRAHDLISHTMAPSWAVLADKAALRADSILARLDDADFQRGIAAMRTCTDDAAPDGSIGFDIDLFVFEASA